jgi:hypothetical protein
LAQLLTSGPSFVPFVTNIHTDTRYFFIFIPFSINTYIDHGSDALDLTLGIICSI